MQCLNTHYAKFEYNRIKFLGVTDYISQTPQAFQMRKNVDVQQPSKNEEIFIKCAQNRVTNYNNKTSSKHFGWKTFLSNTVKNEKVFM